MTHTPHHAGMPDAAETYGPIQILVADDHEVVRLGLKALLEQVPDFVVVGEAGSGREAVSQVGRLHPDVVIMDVRMPDGSGIEACRAIRAEYPNTKVIMLTSYSDNEAIMGSVLAGADGYLLKQVGGGALIDAIRTVVSGRSLLDPAVTAKVLTQIREMAEAKTGQVEALTPQERRVLGLLAEGKTNKEISDELFLTEKTVRNYVSNILAKLNLSNRTEAATYAIRRGLREDREKG